MARVRLTTTKGHVHDFGLLSEGEAIGDVYEEIASYAERGSSRNGSRLVPIPTLQHWAHALAALRSEAYNEAHAARRSEGGGV